MAQLTIRNPFFNLLDEATWDAVVSALNADMQANPGEPYYTEKDVRQAIAAVGLDKKVIQSEAFLRELAVRMRTAPDIPIDEVP